MARIEFFKASEQNSKQNDEALRRLQREIPSGGAIRIGIHHEPDFFKALRVEGRTSDVLLGRERESGKVVAVGIRSEKPCFINGQDLAEPIGYLSHLRIAPEFQKGTVLARGYRALKELHLKGQARIYLSTIVEDNQVARATLASERAGLPSYRDIGGYCTYVVQAGKGRARKETLAHLEISKAIEKDLGEIVEFMKKQGGKRQFFPAYSEDELRHGTGLLEGLRLGDLYLARDRTREGKPIRGMAGLWDQSEFRQWVVSGYAPCLSFLRPFYNIYAKASGRPALPAAGAAIPYRFLSLVCVDEEDEKEARGILASILEKMLMDNGNELNYLISGFHEKDPLKKIMNGVPAFLFRSRLFVVHWEDGAGQFERLDGRVPYVEVGSL